MFDDRILSFGDDRCIEPFRSIIEELRADAAQHEAARDLPYVQVKACFVAGFGSLRIPVADGGEGARIDEFFRVVTAIAAADPNVAQIMRTHSGFVESEVLLGRTPAFCDLWKKRIVDGAMIGASMSEKSDATGVSATLAPQANGGWILNGKKYYTTGTLYADWATVIANDAQRPCIVIVSTDSPGVTRIDDWDGFGQRLTGSGTTIYENVFVPADQMVRELGEPDRLGELWSAYLGSYYQLYHLATLAGVGWGILFDAIKYVRGRTRTYHIGGRSSPKDDPIVQKICGQLASTVFAADAIVTRCTQRMNGAFERLAARDLDQQWLTATEMEIYQAQSIVSDLILKAATEMFEVGGASEVSTKLGFDRHWRNARTLASHNPIYLRERLIGEFYLSDPGSMIARKSFWGMEASKKLMAAPDTSV
jgi:alkylation response protein AidB-like acyl-CoA dehydrogenase